MTVPGIERIGGDQTEPPLSHRIVALCAGRSTRVVTLHGPLRLAQAVRTSLHNVGVHNDGV